MNVFVTFDKFKSCLLNKNTNFFQNKNLFDSKLLNSSVNSIAVTEYELLNSNAQYEKWIIILRLH